jgi:hypothetical protein
LSTLVFWGDGAVGAQARSHTVVCGSVHAEIAGATFGGRFDARGISCRKARVVARYALTHSIGNAPKGPRGWSCARGPSPDVSAIAFECWRRTARVRLLNN